MRATDAALLLASFGLMIWVLASIEWYVIQIQAHWIGRPRPVYRTFQPGLGPHAGRWKP